MELILIEVSLALSFFSLGFSLAALLYSKKG